MRWMKPFASRVLAPPLWRFTRRSVPRGVALGMMTGILVPVAQIPLSALLAFPIRANIPAAAATTFITNPVTTPGIWVVAYWLGSWVLRLDAELPGQPIGTSAAADQGWLNWLLVDVGPATLVGLLLLSIIGAVVGFAAASLTWRWRTGRKWRRSRPVG